VIFRGFIGPWSNLQNESGSVTARSAGCGQKVLALLEAKGRRDFFLAAAGHVSSHALSPSS